MPWKDSVKIETDCLLQISCITGLKIKRLKLSSDHHTFPVIFFKNIRYLKKIDFSTEDLHYKEILKNLRRCFVSLNYIEYSEEYMKGKNKNIKNDKIIRDKLDSVIDVLKADNYYRIPWFLHDLLNKVFFSEPIPAEVMLKLAWIFDPQRKYCGPNKDSLINLLSAIRIITKGTMEEERKKKVLLMKNSPGDFSNAYLLNVIDINLKEMAGFLNCNFLHPNWNEEGFKEYFLIMMFLRSPYKIENKNGCFDYMGYYTRNRNNLDVGLDKSSMQRLRYLLDFYYEISFE